MTLHEQTLPRGTSRRSGDRILVHKFLYDLIAPRRWDVIVFKAPHEPATNYIKRLVGLPGEQLFLIDGNVYVSSDDGQNWGIARKTDPRANRHWRRIQQALWQPIYDSSAVPLDARVDLPGDRVGPSGHWRTPWQAESGSWQIQGRQRYRLESETGSLVFDFSAIHADRWQMQYPYNQLNRAAEPLGGFTPMEDIRLAVEIEPGNRQGTFVELATTARLAADADHPVRRLVVTMKQDGTVQLRMEDPHDPAHAQVMAVARGPSLRAGRTTSIDLWYVDQEAIVFVNDREVLRHRWDWPLEVIMAWPGPDRTPAVSLQAGGGPLTINRVRLDRDIYYTVKGLGGQLARAGVRRTGQGVVSNGPMILGPDDFYTLGDNSPASKDSRFWEWDPHEVEDHALVQYQTWADAGRHDGLVHRNLLIGRAFMVYFPAPIWRGWIPAPDFGQVRIIR